jgi:hypothetical protein
MANSNLLLVKANTFIIKKVNELREYKREEIIFINIPGSN